MLAKGFFLIFSFAMLLSCNSQPGNINSSQGSTEVVETAINQQGTFLVRYSNGDRVEKVVDEDLLPEVNAIVSLLYENAEPVRLYLEDDVLAEMLDDATGFGIRFNPPMHLAESSNKLHFILFLTEGRFSNNDSGSDIIFLTAIDSDDFIRSPFIAEEGIDHYVKLKELLGI